MYIANKEKNRIDCEMFSFKVADTNFYGKYGTLYNYLNHWLKSGAEKILKKLNNFWKIYQKGLSLKRPMLPLKGV